MTVYSQPEAGTRVAVHVDKCEFIFIIYTLVNILQINTISNYF